MGKAGLEIQKYRVKQKKYDKIKIESLITFF